MTKYELCGGLHFPSDTVKQTLNHPLQYSETNHDLASFVWMLFLCDTLKQTITHPLYIALCDVLKQTMI